MMRPAPLLQHLPGHKTHSVKGSLQVRIQDCVEFRLGHFHQQIIPGNARVVDQNVDPLVLFQYAVYHLFTGCVISHIALPGCRFAACRLDGLHRFGCRRFGAVVIDNDKGPLCRELYGDGPANAPGRACYQGDFSV